MTALVSEAASGRRRPGATRQLGISAAAIGMLAIGLASRRLGRALRAHPAPGSDATLHTDGLYGLARHPIYSGILLTGVGLALIARTPRAIATVCSLVALLTFKARFEERLLEERFPEYRAYRNSTPRFVPRFTRRPTTNP